MKCFTITSNFKTSNSRKCLFFSLCLHNSINQVSKKNLCTAKLYSRTKNSKRGFAVQLYTNKHYQCFFINCTTKMILLQHKLRTIQKKHTRTLIGFLFYMVLSTVFTCYLQQTPVNIKCSFHIHYNVSIPATTNLTYTSVCFASNSRLNNQEKITVRLQSMHPTCPWSITALVIQPLHLALCKDGSLYFSLFTCSQLHLLLPISQLQSQTSNYEVWLDCTPHLSVSINSITPSYLKLDFSEVWNQH